MLAYYHHHYFSLLSVGSCSSASANIGSSSFGASPSSTTNELGAASSSSSSPSSSTDGCCTATFTGQTVAAALLGAGILQLGHHACSARPRAPYCLMGVCFECRVTIDGVPDRLACQTTVQSGMSVRTAGPADSAGQGETP